MNVSNLFDLPPEVLRLIARRSGRPDLVVACSIRGSEAARRALREGTDEAEISRFQGAVTVREAQGRLRETLYEKQMSFAEIERILSSRVECGRLLKHCVMRLTDAGDDDMMDNPAANYDFDVTLNLVLMLLCYRAKTYVCAMEHRTILHLVAFVKEDWSVEIAEKLIACGADVNAEWDGANVSEFSGYPVAWALAARDGMFEGFADNENMMRENMNAYKNCCRKALLLIKGGADLEIAEESYERDRQYNWMNRQTTPGFHGLLQRRMVQVEGKDDELEGLIRELLELVPAPGPAPAGP